MAKMFIEGLEWPLHSLFPKGALVYEIKYGSKKDFYDILNNLCKDATVFLPRKYEIFSRKGV